MNKKICLLILFAAVMGFTSGCPKKAGDPVMRRHPKNPPLPYQTLSYESPPSESDEFPRKEIQKLLEDFETAYYTSSKSLEKIEELAKKQGTGEITIFFPVNKSKMPGGEVSRLKHFLDNLVMARMGRKIYFVCIGSASAFGSKKRNQRLAIERSQAPIDLIEKYLVKAPHEFLSVFGTGDVYSAKNVSEQKVHDRYQHVRIIAVYGM